MLPRLRLTRGALVYGLLLGLGLATSRLLGVHGVESALALGLALPWLAGAIGARLVIRARHEGQAPGAGTILLRATGHGLALWAVPVLVLALNQLRVRNCTPVEGLAFLVAGPGVGVVLAAIAGVLWGAAFRRERLATLLAALTPLASAGLGLWEFASTPAIFVYDAFAGWFPGTLYDEDVGFPAAYLTFRGLTVLWGLALMLLLRASWSRGLDRLV
ncbi:MAG TPA: hypothetical protein RMI62_05160, partial [Polyangiaceae bacterium LLY-WYZ-15_(1-7)]|nr:hypothetical protein [Polyangiaceae bacterium LLY-WYZ-15_(1-7)]